MMHKHRNVIFDLHPLDDKRWEWKVYPKLGERMAFGGAIEGDEHAAAATARAEIDAWLDALGVIGNLN